MSCFKIPIEESLDLEKVFSKKVYGFLYGLRLCFSGTIRLVLQSNSSLTIQHVGECMLRCIVELHMYKTLRVPRKGRPQGRVGRTPRGGGANLYILDVMREWSWLHLDDGHWILYPSIFFCASIENGWMDDHGRLSRPPPP